MFSHLYPEKNIPFSSPHFSPIKGYQDILFKLLTLSTNSVTKKIIVVRTVYFYNSGSIFTIKNFVTESVLKIRSFMRTFWHREIGENVGWKRAYNFLGKDEKTRRNLYLLSLKTSLWKRSRTFFRTVYRNKPTLISSMGHDCTMLEISTTVSKITP